MAIIQFANGTKVQFNGTPTTKDVEEIANKLGINKPQQQKQNIAQPQESLADKTSSLVGKGFNAFANLPGIKQAGQVIGGVAGGVSGLIGGTIGGLYQGTAEGIKNTPKLLSGKYGVSDAKKSINNTLSAVKEGYNVNSEFGNMVGSQGTVGFATGGLGRVPNALIAGQQLYEGTKNVIQDVKSGDYSKLAGDGANLAVGLYSAKNTFAKGKQGILVNPKLTGQIKSEVNSLTNGKIFGTDPSAKTTAKATSVYREVIRPTQGEIKNLEIRQKKDINNSATLMAKEGLILKQGDNKKLDTADAVDTLWTKSEPLTLELNNKLKSNPTKQFNLEYLGLKAKSEIDKMTLSATEKKSQKADIDELVNDEIAQNGSALFDGESINGVKQGLWKMGYNQMKPTAQKVARKLGYIIKDDISTKYKGYGIDGLNDQLSQYATASQLLQNAHGRVIKGGAMGGHFAGLAGSLIGNSVKIPVIGPLAGKFGAQAINDYVNNPERITTKFSESMKSKPLPKSMVSTIREFINRRAKQINSTPTETVKPQLALPPGTIVTPYKDPSGIVKNASAQKSGSFSPAGLLPVGTGQKSTIATPLSSRLLTPKEINTGVKRPEFSSADEVILEKINTLLSEASSNRYSASEREIIEKEVEKIWHNNKLAMDRILEKEAQDLARYEADKTDYYDNGGKFKEQKTDFIHISPETESQYGNFKKIVAPYSGEKLFSGDSSSLYEHMTKSKENKYTTSLSSSAKKAEAQKRGTALMNSLYSQEMTTDEMLDMFRKRLYKERYNN